MATVARLALQQCSKDTFVSVVRRTTKTKEGRGSLCAYYALPLSIPGRLSLLLLLLFIPHDLNTVRRLAVAQKLG